MADLEKIAKDLIAKNNKIKIGLVGVGFSYYFILNYLLLLLFLLTELECGMFVYLGVCFF